MTFTADNSAIFKIRSMLPQNVSTAIARLSNSITDKITEIRLRAEGVITVTIENKNYFLTCSGLSEKSSGAIRLTKTHLEDFLYAFSKGSLYNHEKTLGDLYITNNAIRVGIGANVSFSDSDAFSGEITSLNIRIPRHIPDCSKPITDYICKNGFTDGKGVLIISEPGKGKTTILRDLAKNLSSCKKKDGGMSALRVTVIDERNEIYMPGVFNECCIDFVSGVSKVTGIEKASRTLSPQVIICDEIASPEEAEKITRVKNAGIVFIASVHSLNHVTALKKDYIKSMFEHGVFGCSYTLSDASKKEEGEIYEYDTNN